MTIQSAQKRARSRKAVSLIWVAMSGLMFVGFVGLAVDTSYVYFTAEQLQAVADGSALAGAMYVKSDQDMARTKAHDLAGLNKAGGQAIALDLNTGNDAGGDIVVGRFDRDDQSFTPTVTGPNAVKVVAKRASGSALSLIYGRFFGAATANVQKDAIAMSGGATGAGLIALDNSAGCNCTLDVGGNGTLNVQPAPPQTCEGGAGIQVNCSNPSSAVCVGGSALVQTSDVNINGGFSGNADHVTGGTCGGSGSELINQHTGQVIADPLAGVPEPVPSNFVIRTSPGKKNDITLDPGWYKQGWDRNGGNLVLKPGVYVLGDTNTPTSTTILNYNGNGTLCGKGVMLFIYRGGINVNGGAGIQLYPIDLSKPSSYFCDSSFAYPAIGSTFKSEWEGIIFFQSRTNTATAFFNGTGTLAPNGTLYFPSALVDITGNGVMTFTQLIAGRVRTWGSGTINIAYDGRNPTSAGNKVFLVE